MMAVLCLGCGEIVHSVSQNTDDNVTVPPLITQASVNDIMKHANEHFVTKHNGRKSPLGMRNPKKV